MTLWAHKREKIFYGCKYIPLSEKGIKNPEYTNGDYFGISPHPQSGFLSCLATGANLNFF